MNMGRITWVDALKGFAILTVVFGHCVTDCMSSNTYPEYKNIIKIFYDSIYSFHMPLFFIISGYVFFLTKSYTKFKSKALDFSIIYVIWCSLTWLSKFIMSKDVNNPVSVGNLISIVYYPLMVYWYLYVLIWLYIVVSVMKLHNISGKMLVIAAVVAIASKIFHLDIGIANRFFYHLYFFLLGGYILQSGFLEKLKGKHIWSLAILVCLNCLMYLKFSIANEMVEIFKAFVIANAMSVICFGVIFKLKNFGILQLFGELTLQIYVMHCFFTGGLRVLFKHLGIHNVYLYFIVGTALGLIIPIITAKLCKKTPWLNIVFEPLKSLKQLGVIKA